MSNIIQQKKNFYPCFIMEGSSFLLQKFFFIGNNVSRQYVKVCSYETTGRFPVSVGFRFLPEK